MRSGSEAARARGRDIADEPKPARPRPRHTVGVKRRSGPVSPAMRQSGEERPGVALTVRIAARWPSRRFLSIWWTSSLRRRRPGRAVWRSRRRSAVYAHRPCLLRLWSRPPGMARRRCLRSGRRLIRVRSRGSRSTAETTTRWCSCDTSRSRFTASNRSRLRCSRRCRAQGDPPGLAASHPSGARWGRVSAGSCWCSTISMPRR
jgi:hypothetical protein